MNHRQQINAAAAALSAADGWCIPAGFDFVALRETPEEDLSQNLSAYNHRARAAQFLALAEAAFEAITGDRPDYAECEVEDCGATDACPDCPADAMRKAGDALAAALRIADATNSNVEYWGDTGLAGRRRTTHREKSVAALSAWAPFSSHTSQNTAALCSA